MVNIDSVYGVYLPYFKGKVDQIQCYREVLDILQACIDICDQSAVMIIGEMIASEQLVQKTQVYCP